MNDTSLTITGNLTADPEIRVSANGTVIARLTVASTPRAFDKHANAWTDGTTLFLRVVAFGHLADHAKSSLGKGDRVIVTGQLQARTWENDDGTRGSTVELVADEIGAALRYATLRISRVHAVAARDQVSA
jgi:single-strand DNA-binding protein